MAINSADTAELQAMRTRSDTRLADISKIAREFEDGVEVLTHLVHGRPEKELLKCMNTHVCPATHLTRASLSFSVNSVPH